MGKRKFHWSGDHDQDCQTELDGYISLQTASAAVFRCIILLLVLSSVLVLYSVFVFFCGFFA